MKAHLATILAFAFALAAQAAPDAAPDVPETPAPTPSPTAPADPTPALREFFGADLLTHDGSPANLADLNGKIVALYFSASWCPPCRAFTPRLVDLAERLQAEGKPFAVVLVGCDQSKQKSIDYMASHHMTGYLVPPEAPANIALSRRYNVHAIPYLVVVDDTGATLDPSARSTVASAPSPAAAWSRWSP